MWNVKMIGYWVRNRIDSEVIKIVVNKNEYV